MKQLYQNILRFIAFPVFVILITVVPYVLVDPYMDFGKRENYSWKYNFQNLGDLATKKLTNSNYQYNSFIFGSSRSLSLYACYLNSVIPNSSFFHYANWAETISGINSKLALLDSLGYTINNTIIYLDADITFREEGGNTGTKDLLITNSYLINHFKSYFRHFNLDKAKILMGMKVNGDVYPNWKSDPITNDAKHQCNDKLLSGYSKIDRSDSLIAILDSLKETGFLYERPLEQEFYENQISNSEKYILNNIKTILDKHSANYFVIITPLYDQKKFSIQDQSILDEVFGDRLFDFSGINRFTNNEYNYPDRVHFQPYISKYMIDSILRLKPASID